MITFHCPYQLLRAGNDWRNGVMQMMKKKEDLFSELRLALDIYDNEKSDTKNILQKETNRLKIKEIFHDLYNLRKTIIFYHECMVYIQNVMRSRKNKYYSVVYESEKNMIDAFIEFKMHSPATRSGVVEDKKDYDCNAHTTYQCNPHRSRKRPLQN